MIIYFLTLKNDHLFFDEVELVCFIPEDVIFYFLKAAMLTFFTLVFTWVIDC